MYKLDIKDRKILYHLDIDCRQSNTQIGKKVGLKKDVVAYRVKKLQEEGIIKNFYTEIDTFRLGYDVFRMIEQLSKYPTNELRKEYMNSIATYVCSNCGRYYEDGKSSNCLCKVMES